MGKQFGYPEFDEKGEKILCTYDNDYSECRMDIRCYRMPAGTKRSFGRPGEETAVLLLNGKITYEFDGQTATVSRESVFTEGPWTVHASQNIAITVTAEENSDILMQCTKNDKDFGAKLYAPEECPWKWSGVGKYNNTAQRRVNTLFDYDIQPQSNMVLGEILSEPGNWTSYLPHRHVQPECYYFLFDKPMGFGASFMDENVYYIKDGSFAAITGNVLHPQAVAPGYVLYTTWMIRHDDGNPWLQTDRNYDEAYLFLDDIDFEKK